MDINKRLFELLDNKNLKNIDLANYLNINSSVVSTWKKRGTNPPSEYIPRICDFLGVTTSYLLTGEENTLDNAEQRFDDGTIKFLNLFNTLSPKQQTLIEEIIYEFKEKNNSNLK